MNPTLQYIINKFSLNLDGARFPVEIPDFGRAQLADLFRELNFQIGAEIGVKRGEYSEVLCKANPQAKTIYSVDPFKSYEGYRNGRQNGMDLYFAEATERLAPYKNNTIIRKFSVEAARSFPDNSMDWVFIDAAHDLVNAINDIHEWSRVVRSGGCISGHDYIHRGPKRDGTLNTSHKIVEAVTAYTKSYHISPYFVLGRKEFIPGEVRDLERSWLWVNP